MATICLTLSDDLNAFVQAQAAQGGYVSAAEYVQDVLLTVRRGWETHAVDLELVRRTDGPPAIELPPQLWVDLKARVRQRHPQAIVHDGPRRD